MGHKIVAVWCHPRSMSTAIERLMRERRDLAVLHEPFMYDYYLNRASRMFPHFEPEPGHPTTYEGTRDWILEKAEHAPVFFKDMAYYVLQTLPGDPVFARAISHVFLVRNPGRSIPSFWKLDPDLTGEEIGIVGQERLRQALTAILGEAPPVVLSEDIQQDPNAVIGALWRRIDLPPAPHAFDWKPGVVDDWDAVAEWHGDVAESSGIAPPVEDDGAAWLEAVAAAPQLAELREPHQAAYERLKAEALGRD